MEVEVRAVAGTENCFVSLPFSLLQTLESTHPGHRLPHLLPLELRSLSSPHLLWHVAWSGSASSSSAIEIAQEFAACIGLPDRTIVQVRPLPNVPKASLVTIEPLTEDDWEVIELNAEVAEAAILSQVRVVHGKMSFPLWLHGHRIVTFSVVSMVPNKTVAPASFLSNGLGLASYLVLFWRKRENSKNHYIESSDRRSGALSLDRKRQQEFETGSKRLGES